MIDIHVQKHLSSAEDQLLLDVSLQIQKGKFISLFGKSGAGKTTLLKIISGLTPPDSGSIRFKDSYWMKDGKSISPQQRSIGYVFQSPSLFPNLTVRKNLEIVPEAEKKHIEELLVSMGLQGLSERKPATLSGGQKQRVALARALTRKPELLLLDEPFSALDTESRIQLQDEVLKVHKQFGLTTILVSHDIGEVFRLSDTIIELKNGKIIREASPFEFFNDREISGKVRLAGQIMDIHKADLMFILNILSGNQVVKVMVTQEEVQDLSIGDKVLIVSKAFNPVILKI